MRVAISGGTGFVGKKLCDLLLDKEHEVRRLISLKKEVFF